VLRLRDRLGTDAGRPRRQHPKARRQLARRRGWEAERGLPPTPDHHTEGTDMPGFIGFPELLLLGLVALLVFGPKRLPEMGRSLGHGMREFKDSISNDSRKDDERELRALHAGDQTSTPVVTSDERDTIAS